MVEVCLLGRMAAPCRYFCAGVVSIIKREVHALSVTTRTPSGDRTRTCRLLLALRDGQSRDQLREYCLVTAKETGEFASMLRFGLYAYAAAIEIGRDAGARSLGLRMAGDGDRAVGSVFCKDGSERPFDLPYVLDLMGSEPVLRDELDRAWCVSSLILLGDRLVAGNYYDRAPVLEIVRHLRNGIAHGNRFTLRNPTELRAWPAHMRDAACRSSEPFEITPELDGSAVLFDFMGPGDVLDLLITVSTHLRELVDSGN